MLSISAILDIQVMKLWHKSVAKHEQMQKVWRKVSPSAAVPS